MSFNLTSDGSPTPRKTVARFPVPGADLRLDTSPEVLGFGAVGTRIHPNLCHWFDNLSLTTNMQGLKRPLGPSSAQGNQILMQPSVDAFKVSRETIKLLSPITAANHARSSRSSLMILPLSTLFFSDSMSGPPPGTSTTLPTVPCRSPRLQTSSLEARPTLRQIQSFSSTPPRC